MSSCVAYLSILESHSELFSFRADHNCGRAICIKSLGVKMLGVFCGVNFSAFYQAFQLKLIKISFLYKLMLDLLTEPP